MAVMDAAPIADLREATRLVERVRDVALPLRGAGDLDPLMERIGDARFVLLGEASHGTAEYYRWRARLTQRLIHEKGFSFVAVEGDWPDCYRVSRYVKGARGVGSSAREVLRAFSRWPTWMWANEEIADLTEWMRMYNSTLKPESRIGFYGLDVYSLWDSLREVIRYLETVDPDMALTAKWAYSCFEPYGEDVQEYARATRLVPASCEEEVVALLAGLRAKVGELRDGGPDAYFNAEQNALIAKNADGFYRAMVRGGPDSWNVRDCHMAETLDRLMQHHGPNAKAIVWEHNTHVGDARATDMAVGGMVNVGQLVRERHEGDGVVLVGFGSHRGSVIAAREWEAPMQRMPVPEARDGSWEDVLHQASPNDKLLLLSDDAPDEFQDARGHRAIGVVYHPDYDAFGNYVPTVLPRRYDAFLYLDETDALHPLHVPVHLAEPEVPETFPVGV